MRDQASRIRWNSLYYFLSQLIRLVTNFLLFVGIARFYGADGFGQFTTAQSFATIFLLFADFGFDTLLTTEIARDRSNAAGIAQKYFSLKIVFVVFAASGMLLLPAIRSFTPETRLLIEIFSAFVLISSVSNFIYALFKGIEEFHHETRISFGINSLLLAILVLFGILHANLYLIAGAVIFTRLVGLIFAIRISSRIISLKLFEPVFSGSKEVWREVAVFGFYFIFGNLYFSLDTILLAFLRNDHDVGIYQSVFKIAILILLVPDIAINTMMPVLSRLYRENNQLWVAVGRLLYKTLFLLCLPIVLILLIYPQEILDLVYGAAKFEGAASILRMFAFIVFIRFGVEAYALMLTTSHRHSLRTIIVVFATLLNLALNLYMIPRYGPVGAAVASLITNIFVGIGYVVAARAYFVQWTIDIRNIIPFGFMLVLGTILWNLEVISFWYSVPLILTSFGILYYTVAYTKDEWKMILSRERKWILQ